MSGSPIPIERTCPVLDHVRAREGELHERYVRSGRPVVVRGGMDDWGALEKWRDTEYLSAVLGDTTVPASCARGAESTVRPMRLREFWRIISSDTGDLSYYLEQLPILANGEPALLGAVAGDIRVPPYFADLPFFQAVLFAGRDTRCACHYHSGPEAILCQVRGTKRVLLFDSSREQLRALYPQPWYRYTFRYSRVRFPRDGSMPDLGEFPRFARARATECVLEPGDMLYIPLYWWHVTWGAGFNLSVTHFWIAPWRKRFLHPRSFRGRASPQTLQSCWRRLRAKQPGK